MARGVGERVESDIKDIGPSQEACRDALNRILRDPDFAATERDRKFLTYVVEEALAGRADRIKAYSVAVEVFDRDASFDQQNDAIVRVQAGHLRRALDRYYQGRGQTDPIRISMPKGGYAPAFALRSDGSGAEAAATRTVSDEGVSPTGRRPPFPILKLALPVMALAAVAVGAWLLTRPRLRVTAVAPDIPRLLVQPLEDSGGGASSAPIARGLAHEIVGQLTKFKDIVVVEPRPISASSEGAIRPVTPPTRYALAGAIDLTKDSLRLQVRLVDQKNGGVLWANSYYADLKAAELLQIESELAGQVASALAQPYGIIFHADASRDSETPPDDWEAYSCTLRYYAYRATLDPAIYPSVRKCLERAVERFPDYATAQALLSQTYVDETRFGYRMDAPSPPASIDRALAAARRAVQLDPRNVRGLQAEMLSLYFSKEVEAALKVGEEALATNPNDTELMSEYGYRLALSGDWSQGCALVARAHERNPAQAAYFEGALALCAYMRGDYKGASMWIRKTMLPPNPGLHLMAAAIFAEAGPPADAEAERRWLMQNAPDLVKNVRSWVSLRAVRSQDMDRFIGSLKKAGLPEQE